MSRKKKNGTCHLCGDVGPLSFEHVPPEAAFNDHKVLQADIHKLIGSDLLKELDNPKGIQNQRGAGAYTLCASCNNKTGTWYAPAYVHLAKAAMHASDHLRSKESSVFSIRTTPLNLLKQILVMFCSACPPDFAAKNPDLVRYLLNKESRDGPDRKIRIFLSLFDRSQSAATRQSGISGRININTGKAEHYSEICFPPFNLVMALNTNTPDQRLTDITFFRNFDLNQTADITMRLFSLPVVTYLPGDYRGRDEVKN